MRPIYLVMLFVAVLVLASVQPLLLRAQQSPPGTTPPAIEATTTATPTTVTTRTTTLNNQTVGQVLINGRVVMQLAATRGYTANERATLVAERLRSLLAQGHTWNDVRAGTMDRQSVLMVGNNRLVSILPADAQVNRTTQTNLAQTWASSVQVALRPGTTVAGSQEQWPSWTNPETRIVPIFAVGTPGVQIGAAQIKGPADRVNAVRAVLQLDLTFQRAARIRVFVPSSELTGLNRVQGVAVSGLLQYSLFRF